MTKQQLEQRAAGYETASRIIDAEYASLTIEQRLEQIAILERTARVAGWSETAADPGPARENWQKLRRAWLERYPK